MGISRMRSRSGRPVLIPGMDLLPQIFHRGDRRDRRARRDRSFLRPSRLEKRVPTLKNCCSWIYREYLGFLCGLRALCGKAETFGFTGGAECLECNRTCEPFSHTARALMRTDLTRLTC